MDCSQGHVHSLLNPRPEEIELYDQIIQEWLISANMEVDDEVHVELEAEDPHCNTPFISLLSKLINEMLLMFENLVTKLPCSNLFFFKTNHS